MSPASEDPRVRVRVLISGGVQGVGFRFSARQMANQRGLSGWVRNHPEGTVETLVEGEEAAVQEFLTWCRRGPIGAVVTDVQITWERFQGESQEFRIVG